MAVPAHLANPGDLPKAGGTGSGGDTPRGEPDVTLGKDRDPAARSTSPDPASTNYSHPSTPGAIATHPGGGLDSGVGQAIDTPGAATVTPEARQGASAGGINRVEDQASSGNPRLNPASDEAGPGASEQTPELQDPNYTAATERH